MRGGPVAWMLAGMGCYALNDACIKALGARVSPGELLALRGGLSFFLLMAVATARARCAPGQVACPARSRRAAWQTWTHWAVWLRCALEVSAATWSVLALQRAPMATVTAILQCAPLIVVLASIALRWETPRGMRVLPVLVGLSGAALVMRVQFVHPGMEAGLLAALACALSLAGRDLASRRLPTQAGTSAVAAFSSGMSCVAGLAIGFAMNQKWSSPNPVDWLLIVTTACASAAGNSLVIAATRAGDPTVIAPFRYSLIGWSCLFGYLGWSELPGPPELVGIALIAAGGVLAVRGRGRR